MLKKHYSLCMLVLLSKKSNNDFTWNAQTRVQNLYSVDKKKISVIRIIDSDMQTNCSHEYGKFKASYLPSGKHIHAKLKYQCFVFCSLSCYSRKKERKERKKEKLMNDFNATAWGANYREAMPQKAYQRLITFPRFCICRASHLFFILKQPHSLSGCH